MVFLHDVWRAIEGHDDNSTTNAVCLPELGALMAVSPFLSMDLRTPISTLVTASDASEEGGWGLPTRGAYKHNARLYRPGHAGQSRLRN